MIICACNDLFNFPPNKYSRPVVRSFDRSFVRSFVCSFVIVFLLSIVAASMMVNPFPSTMTNQPKGPTKRCPDTQALSQILRRYPTTMQAVLLRVPQSPQPSKLLLCNGMLMRRPPEVHPEWAFQSKCHQRGHEWPSNLTLISMPSEGQL